CNSKSWPPSRKSCVKRPRSSKTAAALPLIKKRGTCRVFYGHRHVGCRPPTVVAKRFLERPKPSASQSAPAAAACTSSESRAPARPVTSLQPGWHCPPSAYVLSAATAQPPCPTT